MSMVQQTVKQYFAEVHSEYNQADVLGMQWQFFRLLFPSAAKIDIKDIHLGKASSTILVTVSQKGKDCMMGFVTITNMLLSRGFSFTTSWKLDPPPIQASVSALAKDNDPRWISYQTPYHPESFRRVQSYLKYFVPYEMQEPSIRDQWITWSNPQTTFTNETLGFVLDISFPILDNFYPEVSTGGQAATVAAGLEQKREREAGITKVIDASSGSYRAPAMITSLSTSIEIKKLLPPEGTKWLFLRAQAKEIKNGRMSMEVLVFDEHMELVALSQQLCPIIDLTRAMKNKQKL